MDRTDLNYCEPIQDIENMFETVNAHECNLCGEVFRSEEDILLEHIEDHR